MWKAKVNAMKRLAGAIAGAAALLALGISPGRAGYGDAQWCAVIQAGDGDVYWDCQYQTFEACRPNVVAGNRGFCNLNPTYRPPAAGANHEMRHHILRHSNRGESLDRPRRLGGALERGALDWRFTGDQES
jgi:Protein of unknown function (DUF3551)